MLPSSTIRLALFQFDIAWEDKAANFTKVEALAAKLDGERVDLIVLPELFATGYTMEPDAFAEGPKGETARFLSALAIKHDAYVLGSCALKSFGKPYNSALVFDRRGRLVSTYVKIHLPSFLGEDAHYRPGRRVVSFDIDSRKIGICICYDLRFPELFRAFANRGADCAIVIANWPQERIEHWDSLLKARAIDNQMYLVGVNRLGRSPTAEYPGHSCAIDPMGEFVEARSLTDEGSIIRELDFDAVRKARAKYSFLSDRVL